jgi:hypothetical protein
LTLAELTPGTLSSAFSTLRTHEAQVIPVIGRAISWNGRSIVEVGAAL